MPFQSNNPAIFWHNDYWNLTCFEVTGDESLFVLLTCAFCVGCAAFICVKLVTEVVGVEASAVFGISIVWAVLRVALTALALFGIAIPRETVIIVPLVGGIVDLWWSPFDDASLSFIVRSNSFTTFCVRVLDVFVLVTFKDALFISNSSGPSEDDEESATAADDTGRIFALPLSVAADSWGKIKWTHRSLDNVRLRWWNISL